IVSRPSSRPADGTLRVSESKRIPVGELLTRAAAVTSDGRLALIGGLTFIPDETGVRKESHSLFLWDLETGSMVRRFDESKGMVNSIVLLPDAKRALTANHDGTLRLWDVQTAKEIRRFEGHQGDVWSVALSPDGRKVIAGAGDLYIHVWDFESGRH